MNSAATADSRSTAGGLVVLPEPTALREAVGRARECHPYSKSGEIALDSSRVVNDAEELWGRLTALKETAREKAVAKLASHECRLLAATAPGRLANRRVRAVLGQLLSVHQLPGAAALAWRAFLVGDGDQQRLRDLAAPMVQAAGEAEDVWAKLLHASSPIQLLIAIWRHPSRHLRKPSMPSAFDEWATHPAIGLSRYPLFLNAVRRALLEAESLALLEERERSTTIGSWVATLIPADELSDWYLTFLTETCPRRASGGRAARERWPVDHAVCDVIYRSMGAPGVGSPFWDSASADVVQAFELWLKDRVLTDVLGGENDRVEFWRRYLIPMRKVERTRDRAVALLYFHGWTAVQFVNSGHATFLFREKAVRGWIRMPETEIYKSALYYRDHRPDFFLGSYEHRGYSSTWQAGASRVVKKVLEQFGGTHDGEGRR